MANVSFNSISSKSSKVSSPISSKSPSSICNKNISFMLPQKSFYCPAFADLLQNTIQKKFVLGNTSMNSLISTKLNWTTACISHNKPRKSLVFDLLTCYLFIFFVFLFFFSFFKSYTATAMWLGNVAWQSEAIAK